MVKEYDLSKNDSDDEKYQEKREKLNEVIYKNWEQVPFF